MMTIRRVRAQLVACPLVGLALVMFHLRHQGESEAGAPAPGATPGSTLAALEGGFREAVHRWRLRRYPNLFHELTTLPEG